MMRVLKNIKSERRKFIELRHVYAEDSWRKKDKLIWSLYLFNRAIAYLAYSIKKLDFRLISSLDNISVGRVDCIALSRICKEFVFDKDASSRFVSSSDAFKQCIVGPFNEEYGQQTPECREYDSEKISTWIRDHLGRRIKDFLHSEYQISSIKIYETACINNVETYNLNSRLHYDELLPGCFRLIVYLGMVDDSNGPFLYASEAGDVQALKGPAGTFVMFKRYLKHAGSNTQNRSRFSMLVDICPSIISGREVAYDLNDRPSNLMAFKNPFTRFSCSLKH